VHHQASPLVSFLPTYSFLFSKDTVADVFPSLSFICHSVYCFPPHACLLSIRSQVAFLFLHDFWILNHAQEVLAYRI
jgi:hypothetical protein